MKGLVVSTITVVALTCGAASADLLEGFEDITLLTGAGWHMQNNSEPLGSTEWFQGNDTVFPAQAGSPASYIAANFNSSGSPGTISNWLLTPMMTLNNGDTLSFYTRVPDGSSWPDRLQVRLSLSGVSTDVGTGVEDVGDFTDLLLDINDGLVVGGYPEVWTQFEVVIAGLAGPTDGRLAFRYYVADSGPAGNNSNYIGIDTFSYTQVPAPASLMLLGTAGLILRRRRR